jgi:predicted ATP-dependent Lon-type protease
MCGLMTACVGHLFGPLPPEMRNDTASMDRIHAYLPGWHLPKVNKMLFTNRLVWFLTSLRRRLRIQLLYYADAVDALRKALLS